MTNAKVVTHAHIETGGFGVPAITVSRNPGPKSDLELFIHLPAVGDHVGQVTKQQDGSSTVRIHTFHNAETEAFENVLIALGEWLKIQRGEV